MMIMNTPILLLTSLLLFGACDRSKDQTGKEEQSKVLELTLQPDNEKQVIHNFGASDAWSCQFVGKSWPLEKRERIADLLFSTEMDKNGNPKGIGLSAWRFNIGGGSAGQGAESKIEDKWRRAECFMNPDGTYYWNKQAGQRWFLRAAKKRGVEQFIGFVNSPPVHFTKNGMTWSSDGNSANLAEEHYADYAEFLAEVVKNVEENEGVHLDYISPFNEPQWDWDDSGQEGSPWKNSEIHNVCQAIDKAFQSNNINSRLEIPETAQNKYLYTYNDKPERGKQIREFFNPSSENYLGDLNSMAQKVAGHSYFSTWDLQTLIETRKKTKQEINRVNPELEYWMSEYCILEDNEEIQGNGRNLGMKPALYMARVIHADLTVATASSWQWWLGVSPYDYKDGLVYIDKDTHNGEVYESKMLWALGHYSRFIRPGMQRIGVKRSDNKNIAETVDGTMVSAYKPNDGERYVVVIVNQKEETVSVEINEGNMNDAETIRMYQTTSKDEMDMAYVGEKSPGGVIGIPARGLVTLVID